MDGKTNDLFNFMADATREMASNYEVIRKRSKEDPGTAGDQGEEDWKQLLENWLPPTYQIAVKGRIVNIKGESGPQVDLLVLHPAYPKKLLHKKHYIAGGVLAAFECKTTLRREHIAAAMQTAKEYKSDKFGGSRYGTPYRELHAPITYGVLAHSAWKDDRETVIAKMDPLLKTNDEEIVQHPQDMIDLICVADVATWTATKSGHFNWGAFNGRTQVFGIDSPLYNKLLTCYSCHSEKIEGQAASFTPIGALITHVLQSLAWEDSSIREVVDHFIFSRLTAAAKALHYRLWDVDIFSRDTKNELVMSVGRRREDSRWAGTIWDEWRMVE